ncbi:helix-turn-helix transcriptional regulator [Arthrobacter sp. 7Tela_A1]|uniref:helix-turn-helix transcriptional regulator n=1 Tax=Arthrobacter sp. 7Tela_A1 TaxID=3093745 RepID=UPI003BB7BD6B
MENHHSTGANALKAHPPTIGNPTARHAAPDALFLGRSGLVKAMAERLHPESAASGCLLIGEAGSGKSALMRHVLQVYGKGSYTIHIRGSAFARRTPFGALTFLLSDLEPEVSSHPVLILRGLTELIRARAAGQTVILAVDNAEELDEFSAMVLSQMVVNRSAHMFAAFRDFSAAPAEFMGLWREGLLTRLDLEPMLPSECAHLLEAELRGPVSRAAAEDLTRVSGGNPSLLLAAAADYRDCGRLALSGGVWVLAPDTECVFPRLYAAMGPRLSGVTQGQRELLDVLALCGALPLLQVLERLDSTEVDTLQEAGLLQLTHSGVPVLSLADPAFGAILRSQLDTARRKDLLDRFPPDQDVAWPHLTAEWFISAGAKVSAPLALSAAQAANGSGNPAAAERFIAADPNHISSPAAVLELALSRLRRGDARAAADAVARHRACGLGAGTSLADVRLLLIESSALCQTESARSGETGERLRLLREQIHTDGHAGLLDEAETMLASLKLHEMERGEAARLERDLILARARCLSQHGQYRESVSLLSGVYARGDENGRGFRILVGSWLCTAWGMTDRQADAQELAATLWHMLVDGSRPDLTQEEAAEAQSRIIHMLLVTGAVSVAAEYLAADEDNGASYGGTLREVSDGMLHAFAGRGAAATAKLLPAVRQLEASDPGGLLPAVSAAAAYAAALQGQRDRAEEHLRTADLGSAPKHADLHRTGTHFTVLARGLLGSADAAEQMAALADADEARGAGTFALLGLVSAVRLGSTDKAQQLLDVASGLQGRFAAFAEDYAKGSGGYDAQLLLLAADAAAALGHELLAHETGERALEVASGAGDRATVRFIHRSRRLQSGEGEGDGEVEDCLRGLTTRERVIARHAAAGTTNKMIASELSISVRTVEGHLYQIYSKLHVGSRRELARLIASSKAASAQGEL